VLVYDNIKAHRPGRRLPVSDATAQVIIGQQQRVRSRFPGTPAGELALLPSPQRNPDGTRAITREHLEHRHRQWADSLGELKRADGSVFDPAQIVLYACRHTYAQRHADAGVPIDVLAELMDHRNINMTRRYFRVGEQRRREAVDRVTALTFDRHGNRIWRPAAALSDAECARYAISQVAVPFGRCSEPSNVQAGGTSCPFRFRCAGCEHFSTDPSHLPDLQAYLQQLMAEAERLRACTGADAWVIEQATPRQEEIQAVRRLIRDIQAGLDGLDAAERAGIDDAVAAIRRARAAIPRPQRGPAASTHGPPRHLRQRRGPADRMNQAGTSGRPAAAAAPDRTGKMRAGRQADSARRRQRVIAALNRAADGGAEISIAGVARAAGVDRSFLYRHHDLLEKIHAMAAAPPADGTGGAQVTRASLQADLLAAHERAHRLSTRIQQLEHRLSEVLGEQVFRESGLGQPASIGQLQCQITRAQQQAAGLKLQLEDRDRELEAARTANRELMAQLNTRSPGPRR